MGEEAERGTGASSKFPLHLGACSSCLDATAPRVPSLELLPAQVLDGCGHRRRGLSSHVACQGPGQISRLSTHSVAPTWAVAWPQWPPPAASSMFWHTPSSSPQESSWRALWVTQELLCWPKHV